MTGPAPAGLFLYAKDLSRLARFYEALPGMFRVHSAPDIVVLRSPDIQLTLHAIPAAIAASITITEPPARRDRAALKFFFTGSGESPRAGRRGAACAVAGTRFPCLQRG